ncbi:hypothetical protein Hamer_G024675 [Homarus americanus]|uniref:Uncharacterized protein n=1 Tax=Homarus americanus TaxID=6706 RepID=A0A8J5MVH1_HOMAM|nr:hypothetical protein Hamer_G024675 [Homarus americanus]
METVSLTLNFHSHRAALIQLESRDVEMLTRENIIESVRSTSVAIGRRLRTEAASEDDDAATAEDHRERVKEVNHLPDAIKFDGLIGGRVHDERKEGGGLVAKRRTKFTGDIQCQTQLWLSQTEAVDIESKHVGGKWPTHRDGESDVREASVDQPSLSPSFSATFITFFVTFFITFITFFVIFFIIFVLLSITFFISFSIPSTAFIIFVHLFRQFLHRLRRPIVIVTLIVFVIIVKQCGWTRKQAVNECLSLHSSR